ncbi:WXG100 family type VII secretion target, partial [Actinosynnema sp. NPDC059335]|uniref:WXG100 family type VII secretion target n=1 Tax=Actinosynnema sp. NPDC059335 TaxID=3346804 RepID=UPI00366C95EA
MELSGYEIYQMVSRGAGPEGLTEAADVSRDARTRIQALGDELRGLTGQLQGLWQGRASDRAAQAVQPIEQSLQRAQETLDRADAALRTQAQSYGRLRQQVQPMATPYPPELTLFDEITPWDTDNELARKAWFEADAHNRRVYAEYVGLTGQNQAMLPQAPGASGGAPGADTAVGSSGGAGVRSGTPAPPQVGDGGGGTSPSSAGGPAAGGGSSPGSAGGDKPSAGGGGKTSASEVGGGDGGGSPRPPGVAGPTAPRQPGERTGVAHAGAGGPGGVAPPPPPPAGGAARRAGWVAGGGP